MNKPSTLVPMRSTAVNFSHGMIVNETDLTAAMHYPVQLMQAVNRAVFGCGVVCGFRFDPDPDLCGTTRPCDPCPPDGEQTSAPALAYPGFKLQVSRGTAIDCFGLPIEVCEPVLVDVSPDLCGCKKSDENVVCIAIRRVTAKEAPRGDCCGDSAGAADCTRVRDHVEIKAFPFDKLPEGICAYLPENGGKSGCGCGCGGNGDPAGTHGTAAAHVPGSSDTHDHNDRNERREICRCLTQCDPCECCGEGWVMLGCVKVCKTGIRIENFPQRHEDGTYGEYPLQPYLPRKYIKTIECLCGDLRKRDPRPTATQASQQLQAINAQISEIGLTDNQAQATLALARVSLPDQILSLFNDEPESMARMLNLRPDDERLSRVVSILTDPAPPSEGETDDG